MTTIFCHVMLGLWLAKFCPFFTVLVGLRVHREIPTFRRFNKINKTAKMSENQPLLAVFFSRFDTVLNGKKRHF